MNPWDDVTVGLVARLPRAPLRAQRGEADGDLRAVAESAGDFGVALQARVRCESLSARNPCRGRGRRTRGPSRGRQGKPDPLAARPRCGCAWRRYAARHWSRLPGRYERCWSPGTWRTRSGTWPQTNSIFLPSEACCCSTSDSIAGTQAHALQDGRVQAADQATGLVDAVLQERHAAGELHGRFGGHAFQCSCRRLQVHAGSRDVLDQPVVNLEGNQAVLLLLKVNALLQRPETSAVRGRAGSQHAVARDRAAGKSPHRPRRAGSRAYAFQQLLSARLPRAYPVARAIPASGRKRSAKMRCGNRMAWRPSTSPKKPLPRSRAHILR